MRARPRKSQDAISAGCFLFVTFSFAPKEKVNLNIKNLLRLILPTSFSN